MKKMILALFAAAFVSSLCFAQQASAPVSQTAPAPPVTYTITGKVDSVSIGDATQGIASGITVIDEKGQKLSFVIKSGTSITAKDGKALTLSAIMKDNKVAVDYKTTRGIHRAQSIKLVE